MLNLFFCHIQSFFPCESVKKYMNILMWNNMVSTAPRSELKTVIQFLPVPRGHAWSNGQSATAADSIRHKYPGLLSSSQGSLQHFVCVCVMVAGHIVLFYKVIYINRCYFICLISRISLREKTTRNDSAASQLLSFSQKINK